MFVFKAIVAALHFWLFRVHLRTESFRLMRNPLRLWKTRTLQTNPRGRTSLQDGDFSTHNHDLVSIYLAFPLTSMNSKGHRGGPPPRPHPRQAPPLPMPQAMPSPPPTHSSSALRDRWAHQTSRPRTERPSLPTSPRGLESQPHWPRPTHARVLCALCPPPIPVTRAEL